MSVLIDQTENKTSPSTYISEPTSGATTRKDGTYTTKENGKEIVLTKRKKDFAELIQKANQVIKQEN
jgi:hypothetical protein